MAQLEPFLIMAASQKLQNCLGHCVSLVPVLLRSSSWIITPAHKNNAEI